MPRRVRWPFVAVLAVVTVWGGISIWRRASRETQVLATTTCPFRGEPVVIISPDVAAEDSQPVRAHEAVHAEQCRVLGPIKYRLRNLSSSGRLALEAPGYCAGALARINAGLKAADVAERMRADAIESLRGIADSARVTSALMASCSSITSVR